jgi:ABC-type bacteriocin/lantibiotic exporter with double-glycine peptidase domain
VLKAARNYGFEAKGFKMSELDKLYEQELPCILFWNFNHFVGARRLQERRSLPQRSGAGPAEDRARGTRRLVLGVVLTFKPSPEFKKSGAPPTMGPALRRRLAGSEIALTFSVICGLFLVIPGLIIPTFTRVFIDDYLVRGQQWMVSY